MKHPFEHMEDTKMRRHYLQLNSYRRVLEQDYSVAIARMCVIVFHVALDEWAVYPVPLLEDEVSSMGCVTCRRRRPRRRQLMRRLQLSDGLVSCRLQRLR